MDKIIFEHEMANEAITMENYEHFLESLPKFTSKKPIGEHKVLFSSVKEDSVATEALVGTLTVVCKNGR